MAPSGRAQSSQVQTQGSEKGYPGKKSPKRKSAYKGPQENEMGSLEYSKLMADL